VSLPLTFLYSLCPEPTFSNENALLVSNLRTSFQVTKGITIYHIKTEDNKTFYILKSVAQKKYSRFSVENFFLAYL
jgi:hypothetical protein